MFRYQYVKQQSEITDAAIEWLYQHSGGIVSVVISLVHDAQEVAILNGKEILNLETLNEAYRGRLAMLHDYIKPSIITNRQTSRPNNDKLPPMSCEISVADDTESIIDLAKAAKTEGLELLDILKDRFAVVEVKI